MRRAYPQFLAAGGENLPPDILRVIFPLDYWPLIKKYSDAHGLDPYLMSALDRAGVDVHRRRPLVGQRRRADAADSATRPPLRAGRSAFATPTSTLTQPETNVRLGMTYFKDLVDRFGGAHYALASYNAGEHRVAKWIAERPGLAQDEFIDDIPFPETQNYVKRILGTAEDYRRLYGGGILAPGLDTAATGQDGRPRAHGARAQDARAPGPPSPLINGRSAGADGSRRSDPLLVSRVSGVRGSGARGHRRRPARSSADRLRVRHRQQPLAAQAVRRDIWVRSDRRRRSTRAPSCRPGIAQADIERIPFKSDTFDIATSFDVVQSVPDDGAALREMARVLKPGGYAVLNVTAFEFLRADHAEVWKELRRYTPASAGRLIGESGLQVVRISFLFASLFPIMLSVRMGQRMLRPFRTPRATRELEVPAAPINDALTWLVEREAALARRFPMPIGSSLLIVARKPRT